MKKKNNRVVDTIRNPLREWDIFEMEIAPIVADVGCMPSRTELLKLGRGDLVRAIRYFHGGQAAVARKLGIRSYNEEHGLHDINYWTDEQIISEYISVLEEHGFTHWPSPQDLINAGHTTLRAAIGKIGHVKLREEVEKRGISLDKKPRRLDHLIPFERKYEILPEVFEEGELKYYFLGLISADGSIVSYRNEQAVELCLNKVDVGILEKLRDRISPDRPIHAKPHKKNSKSDAMRFKISGKEIVNMLSLYMPTHRKSLDLTYPDNIPDEYFRHYLRGYIDGDGTIGVARNQQIVNGKLKKYFVTRLRILGTENFLSGLTKAIHRTMRIAPVKIQRKGLENVFQIEYTGKSADCILAHVYLDTDLFIERKYRVWRYIVETNQETLAEEFGTPRGRLNHRAKSGKL